MLVTPAYADTTYTRPYVRLASRSMMLRSTSWKADIEVPPIFSTLIMGTGSGRRARGAGSSGVGEGPHDDKTVAGGQVRRRRAGEASDPRPRHGASLEILQV